MSFMDGKRHFNTIAWQSFDYAARLGLGVLVNAFIARKLGPSDVGLLSYGVAIVGMVLPILTLGLDSAVVHALARNPSERPSILGSAASLQFKASLLGYVFVVTMAFVLQLKNPSAILIIAIVALQLFFSFGETAASSFQAALEGQRIARARLTAFVLASCLRLCALAVGAGVVAIAFAVSFEVALAGLFLLVIHRRRILGTSQWRIDKRVGSELLKQGLPFAFASFLFAGSTYIDKIVLGQLGSPTDLGLYSAAYQVSGNIYYLAAIISVSVMSRLTVLYDSDKSNYELLLRQVYCALNVLALAGAILVSLGADRIVAVLFGDRFSGSAPMLAIHIWTCLFVFHIHARTRAFIVEGKQRLSVILSAITLALNVALNVALVPLSGGVGAAWAGVISWGLGVVLLPLFFSGARHGAIEFVRSMNPFMWVSVFKHR